MNKRAAGPYGSTLLLILFMLIGAYLRFAQLRTSPAWYPDEGSDLNIAWNLWQGHVQYFGIEGSLLVAARAPLFHLILISLFGPLGYDILVARLITAAAGALTIPFLFLCFKGPLGKPQALVSAGLFAVLPLAVTYNRWAFSYNLLMPLYVLLVWALWQVVDTRRPVWMLVATVCVALSLLTVWVSIALVLCLFVVGWFYLRRSLLWSIPLSLLPSLVFLVWSYSYSPVAFQQDFGLTFARANGSLFEQFLRASLGYPFLIESNYLFVVAIAGLFLVQLRRLRLLLLLVFFTVLLSVLRFSIVADAPELGFYRILGLVPLIAVGVTVLLFRAIPFVLGLITQDVERIVGLLARDSAIFARLQYGIKLLIVPLSLYLLIGTLFIGLIWSDLRLTTGQMDSSSRDVLATPLADAQRAIDYVNSQAGAQDLVIASPQIGWAVHAQVADFQQVLSYQGYVTDNYPIPVQPSRFVRNISPTSARFAIVDRMWRVWAVGRVDGIKPLLDAVDHWPVALRAGDFVVYQNPNQ